MLKPPLQLVVDAGQQLLVVVGLIDCYTSSYCLGLAHVLGVIISLHVVCARVMVMVVHVRSCGRTGAAGLVLMLQFNRHHTQLFGSMPARPAGVTLPQQTFHNCLVHQALKLV